MPSVSEAFPPKRVWFEHRAWIPVAWVLSLVNLGAVWFAALPGEAAHATTHALLALGFGLGADRLAARARSAAASASLADTLDLNDHLQQTVDNLEAQVDELEERLDFADRLLARQRTSEPVDAPRPDSGQHHA